MRTLLMSVALAAMLAFCGCKGEESSTVETSTGDTLTLQKPGDVHVARDREAKLLIKIVRNGVAGPVGVQFSDLPLGVKVDTGTTSVDVGPVHVGVGDPKPMSIAGDQEVFTFEADDDAPLVEGHEATVTITAPDGTKASQKFKITVMPEP